MKEAVNTSFQDWLITGHSRLSTRLLGFNFLCSISADLACLWHGHIIGILVLTLYNPANSNSVVGLTCYQHTI